MENKETPLLSVKKIPQWAIILDVILILGLIGFGIFLIYKNSQKTHLTQEVSNPSVDFYQESNFDESSLPQGLTDWQIEELRRMGTTTLPSNRIGTDKDIVAQTVETIAQDVSFQLKDFPNADFVITRIALGTGGMNIPVCGMDKLSLSVKSQGEATHCVNTSYELNGVAPALMFVGLQVSNNGGEDMGGKFLKVFYESVVNGKKVTRQATENPAWAALYVAAFSDRTIPLGFVIPSNIEEVSVIYGNYEDKYSNPYSTNSFELSEGTYRINLKTKTIKKISS